MLQASLIGDSANYDDDDVVPLVLVHNKNDLLIDIISSMIYSYILHCYIIYFYKHMYNIAQSMKYRSAHIRMTQ